MSRLKKPKSGTGEKYAGLFGSKELGEAISAIHRTTISGGYELEEVIESLIPSFVNAETGVTITDHSTGKKHTADLVCLDGKPFAVELKNGAEFDTKKSSAEWENIQKFAALYSQQVGTKIAPKMCLFPCRTRRDVVNGVKRVIKPADAFTGKMLCDRLHITHTTVTNSMTLGQSANLNDFVDYMLGIPKVRNAIKRKLKKGDLLTYAQAVSDPAHGEPGSPTVGEVDTFGEEDNLSVPEITLATSDPQSGDGE